jgi:hypothetical protein
LAIADRLRFLESRVRRLGDFGKSPSKDKFAKGECFGEPNLNELFSHWRDADLAPLRDNLIWLCDYYTHRTKYVSGESREFDGDLLHTRFPATILAWFRLRESLGLATPAIDHPLMKPDYTRLHPARRFYSDKLIDGALNRLRREEIADLGNFSHVDVGTFQPRPTLESRKRKLRPFWKFFS